MPHKDPEVRRAYQRKKYYANLERERASRRKSSRKAYYANLHRVPGVERFICRTCAEEKDACEFPPRGKQCQVCRNAYLSQYHYANVEKDRVRARAYRAKHREEDHARSRQYYVNNKAASLAYQAAYREQHRTYMRTRDKAYQASCAVLQPDRQRAVGWG